MTKLTPVKQLHACKQRLGEIVFLEFETPDLIVAHQKLGEEVKLQAQKILRGKLDKLNSEQFVEKVKLVRQCEIAIKKKLLSTTIDDRIRCALDEYLNCLLAWSHGAQLSSLQHQLLNGLVVDEKPISALDLALLLQNDNTGCQTGVYKEQDGSVILWHTEEDVKEEAGDDRFDKLRIVTFRIERKEGIEEISAFVYPDLLPGPAYGWRSDNFVQVVDALHLKSQPQNGNMLANIATWITLRLGKEVEPQEVIEALGPFLDGYAIIVVKEKSGQIFGNKIEFAGDQKLITFLADNPGSFLFQVNVFSEKEGATATVYEDINPEVRKFYEGRIYRTERAVNKVKKATSAHHCLFKLLSSRAGGDYAYANEDVKSYFVGKVSSYGMELWLGEGPALSGDTPRVIRIKR